MKGVPLLFNTDGKSQQHWDKAASDSMKLQSLRYQHYLYLGYTFESHLHPLFAICHIGRHWDTDSVDLRIKDAKWNQIVQLANSYKTLYNIWMND